MKKTILVLTAAIMLIVLSISSACLTSYTQLIHETPEISDDNQQATSLETTENGEKSQESIGINASRNQAYNINDAKEAENLQSNTSNEPSESSTNISQDENTWTDTCPPDGRIYWTPEPPYAYTPTYTPKRWTNLPIIPLELEN